MTIAWRLVKERHVADAFSGEGARLYGGRWNRYGTPMVYVGENLSLAVLGQFVHIGPEEAQLRFVHFRLEIPDNIHVEVVKPNTLPDDWWKQPVPASTQDLGTAWAEEKRSAVLRIPSFIVPVDYNYALNPHHPDFQRIRIGDPRPFSLDPRMWKVGF